MSETFFRLSDIEFGNSPSNDKIVGIFRFDQSKNLRQGPCQIVIAEINSSLYAYEQLLDVINAAVEQSRALLAGMTMDPFARFEKIVQKVNEAITDFQDKEPTPINWGKVNIFIIECHKDQLCITGRGHLSNMFLQKADNNDFKVFDLCGSLEQPVTVDPQKVFCSLICGDMKAGDIFFIGTTNFDRFKQELQIKQKLSELPSVSAAVEIKHALEASAVPDDFAAAIVSCHSEDKASAPIAEKKMGGMESMRNLHENEQKTNTTLAPVINPVKLLKNDSSMSAESDLPMPVSPLNNLLDKIKGFGKHRANQAPGNQTMLRNLNAGHGNYLDKGKKKYIIIGISALAIIIIGYAVWKHNQTAAAQQAIWDSSYNQAVDYRNQAESSLVYAKDSQTRTEIDMSEKILTGLDTSTADRKARAQKLSTEISQIKEKLRKLVPLSGVTELYSLPVTSPDNTLAAPIMTEKYAYVADNQLKQVLKIDLATKETKKIAYPSKMGDVKFGSLGDLSIVFMDDKGQLMALTLANDQASELNKLSQTSSTSDLVVYNKRAYVLDGQSGKILRYTKTDAGFGSASRYIQDPSIDLVGAVGLAIDSNVYVAKSNGQILKFLSGKQETFSPIAIDPPMSSVSSIWTDLDDPRIMVTDPAEKRIVIFDKNGLLTAQLTSNEFGVLKDIKSRTNSKQAVVLSGNRLLLVPLP
ncbi:MAG: hypothetical protein WCW31_00280 [Patescibacteria group bacterium]